LAEPRTEHLGYVGTKTAIKEELRAQTVEWASVPLPRATILLIEDKANGQRLWMNSPAIQRLLERFRSSGQS